MFGTPLTYVPGRGTLQVFVEQNICQESDKNAEAKMTAAKVNC